MTTDKMKAIVFTEYGAPEVLQFSEVEKPSPRENEILIRINATAVHSGDWRVRKADPFLVRFFFGFFKPKKHILGSVLSGEVVKTGKDVTRFVAGDRVFGLSDFAMGTYAEFICLPESAPLAAKPEHLTHEETATIPFGAHTALHFLKKADIRSGQKVLVYGASGAVGTAAVQLARYFGTEVTGVCSTANIEMVKSIGAHQVIDYTKDDLSRWAGEYDIVFETVNKTSVSQISKLLKEEGILILSAAMPKENLQGLMLSLTSKKKVIMGVAVATAADMNFLKTLIEAGKFKAVIDKTYPLEQMSRAHRYVEEGHKKGNVAVTVAFR